MALDLNIYEGVFNLLGVETTGNPVNDAVYLILLPMIVLYLYSAFVVTMSRFGGKKISVIMMFIVGYIIIEKGFYKLFAAWSLPLLGIIMIYHAGSFILGWGHKGSTAKDDISGYMQGAGNAANWGKRSGLFGRVIPTSLTNPRQIDNVIKELTILGEEWADTDKIMVLKGLTHPPEAISKQRSDIIRSASDELLQLDRLTRQKVASGIKGVPSEYLHKIKNIASAGI